MRTIKRETSSGRAPRLSQISRQRGMTLIELVICLGLAAMVLMVAIPALGELARSAGIGSVSRMVSTRMAACRAQAVLRGRSVGLVLDKLPGGGWICYPVEDGDNDGIRRDDIRAGRDRRLEEPVKIEAYGASPGILSGERIPDPSGRGWLDGDLSDPIRAGRGDIISFSPQGTASPCSIYLTDHRWRMRVIRVYGGTGKLHILKWRPGQSQWEPAGL